MKPSKAAIERRSLRRRDRSTQLIVGADESTDAGIIASADTLYRSYRLAANLHSAFSPISHSSPRLPNRAPPLLREHRLHIERTG